LKPAERAFLAALGDVVFGNPFSDERDALVRRLVPGAAHGALDREALAQLTEPHLLPYARAGVAGLAQMAALDRQLVETGFLYVCYHRHVPRIDALIERQVGGGEGATADELAGGVIGELVERGFEQPRALRYYAFFFQLRRAFRFIVQSLAGECESMRRLRQTLWNNVFTHDMRVYESSLWDRMEDFSTLILGETGTGKGSVAAAIGRSEFIPFLPDKRRFAADFTGSFIALNLSEHPESLIESELFGHRKGAFTNAIAHHEGVLSRCNAHGALFLDEIGEVSVPVQIKLLRVLQDRGFTAIGSHDLQRFAGRVIAATNRPLAELRRSGRFREDFFYRLCSDVIVVPTLRQRIEESPAELQILARLLVARIAGAGSARLEAFVMESLERGVPRGYPWPGNVRELEQAVRRILLSGGFAPESAAAPPTGEDRLIDLVRGGNASAPELLGRYCAMLYARCGTYAEVAERTGLDRRTVRKHVQEFSDQTLPAPPRASPRRRRSGPRVSGRRS
jgi:DNA-binding NtrC family response regulator